MNVVAFLAAGSEPAHLMQPSQGTFVRPIDSIAFSHSLAALAMRGSVFNNVTFVLPPAALAP